MDETTLVFLAQKWMRDPRGAVRGRMAHDRLLIAINPKDRAIVPEIDPTRLGENGWDAEAHGGWLLLYRLEPRELSPDAVEEALRQASDLAASLLGER